MCIRHYNVSALRPSQPAQLFSKSEVKQTPMTQSFPPKGTALNGGRYRIDEVLGQGGFGSVYLAVHIELQAQVAIKATADTDPGARQAFLEEARLLSRLRHDHLPRVTDFFIEGQQPYLVMDYIAGKDLDQVLAERGGAIAEVEALAWMAQVLDALAYLHRQVPPIVHRDVKPGNIRIAANGIVYLVDFGIAKVGDGGTHTQMAARAISPPFSPPEQYGGALRTGAYSDVYALGATLYVLLTGALPPESVARSAGVPLPPPRQINPQISARTEQIIITAMDMQPGARYLGAKEFLAALSQPADAPGMLSTQVIQGQPCPNCGKPPVTPNAPFCHACGGPILLPFSAIGRMLGDPSALEATCDQDWQGALKHLQSGLLLRWLGAYGLQDRIRRLQEAQACTPGDPDAIMEALLRPNPPRGLGVDRSALDFGTCTLESRPHLALTIQRRHPGYIYGSIQAEHRWITLSTSAIRLRPHETTLVCNVGIDLTQLSTSDAQQSYASAVVVMTNHGNLRLPVQITVGNVFPLNIHPSAEFHRPTIRLKYPDLMNRVSRQAVEELILHRDYERLWRSIAYAEGGRYLLTGYGPFGGTSLVKCAIEKAREELQRDGLSEGALLAFCFQVTEDKVGEFDIEANNFSLGRLRARHENSSSANLEELKNHAKLAEGSATSPTQRFDFSLTSPLGTSFFNRSGLTSLLYRNSAVSHYDFPHFVADLNSFFEHHKDSNALQQIILRLVGSRNLPSRVVIIIDRVRYLETLENLSRFELFRNNRISRFFRTCRGKRMFSDLVLAHHKAMRQKRLTANLVEKQGELFQVFLMR
jgi:serine/threonine protein kinase